MAGAEVDYDYEDVAPELRGHEFLDAELYSAFVYPLVEWSGVDLPRGSAFATVVRAQVWRGLLRRARRDCPNLLADLQRPMTPREFILELVGTPWAQSENRRKLSASSPNEVARHCHWLIRERSKTNKPPAIPILYGLAGLGAFWNELSNTGYCEICGFRRALTDRRFCDFHSQSGSDAEDRSQRAANYRLGKKARVSAESMGIELSLPNILGSLPHMETLCHLLFPSVTHKHLAADREMLNLQLARFPSPSKIEAAIRCPRVAQKIGARRVNEMDYLQLISLLRTKLDPLEWAEDGWPLKITLAERWFALEDDIASVKPKRGASCKTLDLLPKAIEMARGFATVSDIARKLGVSPSKISRMRRRFSELDDLLGQHKPFGGRPSGRRKKPDNL